MHTINQKLFLSINHFAQTHHTLDIPMIIAAKYTPYIFIGLLFYLWIGKRKNEALYAGYTATLGVGINIFIGLFYFHPRPFMDHLGTTLLSHKADSSFPSDHTTFTMSIALMLLSFKTTRTIGIIAVFLALWCGVARIYAGVHYPFDILGSVVVSILAVVVIMALKNRLALLNNIIISVWQKIIKE